MTAKSRNLLVFFLWLIWVAIVLIPFLEGNVSAFRSLFESLTSIISACWFWFLSLGLGWRVGQELRLFQNSAVALRPILARLLLASGLGLGLLAMIILLVGIVLGVKKWILLMVLVMLVLGIGSGWAAVVRELGRVWQLFRVKSWKPGEVFVGLVILGICVLQLPAALTPTLYPDTLRYHFGLTRLFEQMGCIAPIPDFAEANISSNWQMVYLPQLLLSGDACAQVFNWMTLPMTAAIVGLAAGSGAGFSAALVLVSTPFLLGVAGFGNNDLGVTFFAACMWLALRVTGVRSPFFLSGLFGGFAVGTKYPALLAVVAILGVWFFFSRFEESFRSSFSRLVSFIGGAFLGYGPWFIRNFIWTRDPFYPALSRWLPWGSAEGKWVADHYAREMAHYGLEGDHGLQFLLLPWRMSVADKRYFECDFGILFWCVAPLVIWMAFRRSHEGRILAAATLFGGCLWGVGPQVTRFLGPLIPVASLAVGFAWKEWMQVLVHREAHMTRRFSILTAFLLVGINVWQTLTSVAGFSDPYAFLLGRMNRKEYQAGRSYLDRMALTIVAKSSPSSTVLLLGEEEVFLFQNPVRISGPFDQKWIVTQAALSASPIELLHQLRQTGIDYLCVNRERMEKLDRRFGYMSWPSKEVQSRFLNMLKLLPVLREGFLELYRIPRSDAQLLVDKK